MTVLGLMVVFILSVGVVSCDISDFEPPTFSDTRNLDRSTIVLDTFPITPPARYGYSEGFRFVAIEADTLYERDTNNLPIYGHDGIVYLHPLQIARFALRMRNSYEHTGEDVYLDLAKKAMSSISNNAYRSNGAMWLTYPFDYRLHSKDEFELPAPWYSGMTGGIGLLAAVAMFETTKDSAYMEMADKLFKSFDLLWGESEPWIARIDSNGYYWIEEYPANLPGITLNGAIIGMEGLYEYAFYTDSELAKQYLRGALATFAQFAKDFRRPGELSYYCLGHGKVADRNYHILHISLYRLLNKISANPFFDEFADSLTSDLENYDLKNK